MKIVMNANRRIVQLHALRSLIIGYNVNYLRLGVGVYVRVRAFGSGRVIVQSLRLLNVK